MQSCAISSEGTVSRLKVSRSEPGESNETTTRH